MTDAPAKPSPAGQEPPGGSLLVIFLTVFIDLLGFGMVLPLLPIYAKSLLLEPTGWEIAGLMSCFSLMQFIFAPLWGRLSDRIGRRPVLMVGLLGSVVFYGLFGLASLWGSLALLYVARIGAGISGATISTAQAYIADVTTPQTRARGMALIGLAFGLGFTIGPLLAWAALFSTDQLRDGNRDTASAPAAETTSNTGAADRPPARKETEPEITAADLQASRSPWPGFVAAGLSGIALLLAVTRLPESLRPGHAHAEMGLFNRQALVDALSTPTILPLLITSCISVVAFGGYEMTISLLLKESFQLGIREIPLFFAYIGLILSLVQGGLVRRLSGKVPEITLAAAGGILTIVGFLLLALASIQNSFTLLMAASAVEVSGFAFMTPSLQSLISRRSDPATQGGILGVSQGVSAMARIVGPLVAYPLFFGVSFESPYFASMGLMLVGLALLLLGARGGKDYGHQRKDIPPKGIAH